MEFVADHDLGAGAKTYWDVIPQMQVTLSRRQHVRASAGLRMPMNERQGRDTQFVFYMLWDWFDGTLKEGWK